MSFPFQSDNRSDDMSTFPNNSAIGTTKNENQKKPKSNHTGKKQKSRNQETENTDAILLDELKKKAF